MSVVHTDCDFGCHIDSLPVKLLDFNGEDSCTVVDGFSKVKEQPSKAFVGFVGLKLMGPRSEPANPIGISQDKPNGATYVTCMYFDQFLASQVSHDIIRNICNQIRANLLTSM